MKNFEAYEEKIKELNYNFAIKNDECVRCINICERCEFISNPFGSCPQNKTKWLYKEYIEPKPKVKIPLATKYFLESLNDKYEWIAKDEDGAVWCYKFKPENIHKITTKDGLYMVGVILLALEMFSKKKYLIFFHGKMKNQLTLKNF